MYQVSAEKYFHSTFRLIRAQIRRTGENFANKKSTSFCTYDPEEEENSILGKNKSCVYIYMSISVPMKTLCDKMVLDFAFPIPDVFQLSPRGGCIYILKVLIRENW